MSLEANEVRYAPNGHIFVGPLGVAVPTNTTTPWESVDPDWVELGYTDTDGVSITPNVETNDINAWQSLTPLLKPITGVSIEIAFNLMQLNEATTSLYFFGAEWTGGATGKLLLPATPTADERALGVEWTDNRGEVNRLVIYRGQVTNREALKLTRSDAIVLGVTFEALTGDDNNFGEWITENVNLNPAS